jgi:DNA repair protein RAD57
VSDRLKALAVEFGLAVVVINQVSDVFSREPAGKTPLNNLSTSNGNGPPSSQSAASQVLSQFYVEGPEPPMLYATQSRHFSGQTEQLKKEASLGIVWANAVNARIMLSRTGRRRMIDPKDLSRRRRRRLVDDEDDGKQAAGPDVLPLVDDARPTLIRRAQVVFSSSAPPATIDYVITESGLHSMPDSYRLIDIAETLRRRERMARAILYGDAEDDVGGVKDRQTRSEPTRRSDAGMSLGQAQSGRDTTWTSRNDIGAGDERSGRAEDDDDEFGEEVFDDLGDLPLEFWEGKMDQVHVETLAYGVEL